MFFRCKNLYGQHHLGGTYKASSRTKERKARQRGKEIFDLREIQPRDCDFNCNDVSDLR